MDAHRIEDQSASLNQVYDFRVTELSEDGRRIVVSRRKLLEAELRARADELRARRSSPARCCPGHVASPTDFGAFVDLGGVSGLVHVPRSRTSASRARRTSCSRGQAVTVKVLKVDPKTAKIARPA